MCLLIPIKNHLTHCRVCNLDLGINLALPPRPREVGAMNVHLKSDNVAGKPIS